MKQIITILFFAFYACMLTAQTSKNIELLSAGTLSTVLTSSEKSTITNLTLSGNIDARDMKCLRDEMTVLSVLDMSTVTIKSYNGSDGTYLWGFTTYPANEFPKYSFNPISGLGKPTLTNIIFPNSINSIGSSSFVNCNGLKTITIPVGVISIGDNAFYSCTGLNTLIIPNSVETLGKETFQNCSGLSTLTLGSGIKSIDNQCFYKCDKLKVVNILNPEPPSLNTTAFSQTYLSVVYVPDGSVTKYKAATGWSSLPIATDKLVIVNDLTAGKLKDVLKAIPNSSIYSISRLKVTGNIDNKDISLIRDSLTLLIELDISGTTIKDNYLPDNAFNGKATLSTIKLPDNIVSIGDYAFAYCTNLAGTAPLPPNLRTIGNSAFTNCLSLTGDLNIPNTVTSIGSYAFKACLGLNGKLTLPQNITNIQGGTFSSCRGLTGTLQIPLSVQSIDYSAFYELKKISELVIEKNTSTIGEDAFSYCLGLNKISVKRAIPPTIFSYTFGSVNKTACTLEVPFGSKAAYQADANWKLFTNIVEKSDTVRVTVQVGVGGKVKENSVVLPNDTVMKIVSGVTKTFTIETEAGYEIDSVKYNKVDVKSQLVNNQYTTAAINADATFKVTFKRFYNINIRVGQGGVVKENNNAVTDNELIKVYAGDRKTFTILPGEGFDIDSITYAGQKIALPLVNNQYTTPAASSSETLNVAFKPTTETYDITFNIGLHGSVKVSDAVYGNGDVLQVKKYGVKTFTFVTEQGYEIDSLKYGGVDVKGKIVNGNQFTTDPIVAVAVLKVTFKKVQYHIELKDASSKGSIILLVDYGDTPSFSFKAEQGWKISSVQYNNVLVSLSAGGIYQVPAVTADGILKVAFESTVGAPQLIDENERVYTTQSEIVIEGATENELISVYLVNGTRIQTVKSQGEKMYIPVQRNAVYLVKTANKTYKVIL